MPDPHPSHPDSSRLLGLDLARALAFLGMVIVNFKVVMGASTHGPSWLVMLTGALEGRAAATFVMLAGIGISLGAEAAKRHGAGLSSQRLTILRRALFLFVLGLCYSPIWPADILHFYGVYLACAAVLLARSDRSLLVISAALPLLFVMMAGVFDYAAGWNWVTLEYSGFWTVGGMIRHLFFNGFHPVIPWLSFLLFGMWIGRQDLRSRLLRRNLFVFGLCLAVLVEGLSAVMLCCMGSNDLALDALLSTAPMPPVPLYTLAACATACVVIVSCLVVAERFATTRWIDALVKTGQLALSLYVAHVLVGMGVLDELGMLQGQNLAVAVSASLLFFAGSLLAACAWRRHFARGPLEWLMRRFAG